MYAFSIHSSTDEHREFHFVTHIVVKTGLKCNSL